MSKKLLSIIFLVLTAVNLPIFAQQPDYIELNGEVVDNLFNPIAFVTIVSKKTGIGTISRDNGIFRLEVSAKDTLLFSALSYKRKEIPVKQLIIGENYIVLDKNVFLLGEVNVMELRWKEFQDKVMNADVKREEETKLQIEDLPNIFQKRIELSPYAGASNPISLALIYFKKENIRKRKQKRWRKIYRKSWIEKK